MAETYEPFIEQYLKPEYWGGHSIGGVGEPLNAAEQAGVRSPGGAARLIENYINSGRARAYFPLQTINWEEGFDPAAFNPGTVFTQRLEMLVSHAHVEIDFDSLVDVPMPYPQHMIDGKYLAGGRLLHLQDAEGKITYISGLAWGVIVETRKGKNGMAWVPENTFKSAAEGIKVNSSLLRAATVSPQLMGGVDHYREGPWPYTPVEMITRMHWTDILCEGDLKKDNRRDSILASFRRLVIGNGFAG